MGRNYNGNVGGEIGNGRCNGNIAGETSNGRCNGNVAGETGLIRCDCECVFECLLALLAEVAEENNHCTGRVRPNGGFIPNGNLRNCRCVYECLFELLEDALEENNNHKCHR